MVCRFPLEQSVELKMGGINNSSLAGLCCVTRQSVGILERLFMDQVTIATSLWAGHQMLCGLGHWACQQPHCGLDINFYVGWDIGHASNLIVGRTSNVMWAGTLSMSATSLWAGQPLCKLGHWACQQPHCGLDINFDVGWDIEHVSNLFVGWTSTCMWAGTLNNMPATSLWAGIFGMSTTPLWEWTSASLWAGTLGISATSL